MQIHYDVRKLISDMNQRDFEEEHKQQCCFPRVPSVVSKKQVSYSMTSRSLWHYTCLPTFRYINTFNTSNRDNKQKTGVRSYWHKKHKSKGCRDVFNLNEASTSHVSIITCNNYHRHIQTHYSCGNEEGPFVKHDISVLIIHTSMLITNYRSQN